MKKSKVKLKELRFGRLNVPGYELIICEGSEVVYRQNDSSIISRRTIKKVAEQIIEYQVKKGRQQKPVNLIKKLKTKIKIPGKST
ncbi:hypothetical protein [Cyclobacterium sp. SYSU L10401]|uniref:hypothetical protein n=1 Tax=Cyclobacterium sp. SYSU L10401 TaxID=2678657 RepID=UPI0013D73D52|nr:hypothetical protein [Cyclobacterium sp. SYSU L10401]